MADLNLKLSIKGVGEMKDLDRDNRRQLLTELLMDVALNAIELAIQADADAVEIKTSATRRE